jgi:hypothetical protein
VKKLDPRGYYAALKVGPGSSRQEIRLAYELLKQARKRGKRNLDMNAIQAAYEVLGDAESRRQYDERCAPSRNGNGRSRLHSIPLLLALTLVFAGVLWLAFAPQLRAHFVSFDVGDDLAWRTTHKNLGVVVAIEDDHEFSAGNRTAAYRVQPASGVEPIWLPAQDLNANCVRHE